MRFSNRFKATSISHSPYNIFLPRPSYWITSKRRGSLDHFAFFHQSRHGNKNKPGPQGNCFLRYENMNKKRLLELNQKSMYNSKYLIYNSNAIRQLQVQLSSTKDYIGTISGSIKKTFELSSATPWTPMTTICFDWVTFCDHLVSNHLPGWWVHKIVRRTRWWWEESKRWWCEIPWWSCE